jgi:hypothetical protein
LGKLSRERSKFPGSDQASFITGATLAIDWGAAGGDVSESEKMIRQNDGGAFHGTHRNRFGDKFCY